MQSNDQPPEYFDHLWENFLLGSLSDKEALELLNWLEKNPQELERRRADAALSAGMSYLLGPPHQTQQLILSVQARLEGAKPGVPSGVFAQSVMQTLKRKTPRKLTTRKQFFWPSLAAGILLLVGMLVFFTTRNGTSRSLVQTPPPPIPPVEVASAKLVVGKGTVLLDGASIDSSKAALLSLNAKATLQLGALATLTLADGSTLELSENASVTLRNPQNGPRVLLENGQAAVSARKQADGTSLTLETPHAVAAVVGTRYTARVFNGLSSVQVTEGKVDVSTKSALPENGVNRIQLQAGEELRASPSGLGKTLRNAGKRIVDSNAATFELETDPVVNSAVLDEQFNGMSIRRLLCVKPRSRVAMGFCGISWPVALAPVEDRIEMWVRPRSVKPHDLKVGNPQLLLIMSLGTTDYQVGDLYLSPTDTGWMLLSGRLDNSARLNWVKPGTTRIPLRPDGVKNIALRSAHADMEFDYTGIVIWRN